VLEALDSVEELADLLLAHYDRKCLLPAASWDDIIDVPSPLQPYFVEKVDGGYRHTDRARRKPSVAGQVK
jgi:hypothetical protein